MWAPSVHGADQLRGDVDLGEVSEELASDHVPDLDGQPGLLRRDRLLEHEALRAASRRPSTAIATAVRGALAAALRQVGQLQPSVGTSALEGRVLSSRQQLIEAGDGLGRHGAEVVRVPPEVEHLAVVEVARVADDALPMERPRRLREAPVGRSGRRRCAPRAARTPRCGHGVNPSAARRQRVTIVVGRLVSQYQEAGFDLHWWIPVARRISTWFSWFRGNT